jgi:hypothetical protein
MGLVHRVSPAAATEAAALDLAAEVAAHPPEAVARLKAMLHRWDGVVERSADEGRGQIEWQRSGPGLPFRAPAPEVRMPPGDMLATAIGWICACQPGDWGPGRREAQPDRGPHPKLEGARRSTSAARRRRGRGAAQCRRRPNVADRPFPGNVERLRDRFGPIRRARAQCRGGNTGRDRRASSGPRRLGEASSAPYAIRVVRARSRLDGKRCRPGVRSTR